ncbi:MAG: hypothetical protein ACLT40_06500, partial [Fusobacterium sp.]
MKKFIIEDSKKIFFTLALVTVTACGGGGGGGGGGGNTAVRPNIPNPPSINIPNVNDGSYDVGFEINTNNQIS